MKDIVQQKMNEDSSQIGMTGRRKLTNEEILEFHKILELLDSNDEEVILLAIGLLKNYPQDARSRKCNIPSFIFSNFYYSPKLCNLISEYEKGLLVLIDFKTMKSYKSIDHLKTFVDDVLLDGYFYFL